MSNCRITNTYQGGRQNHISNQLNKLDGQIFATREDGVTATVEENVSCGDLIDTINSHIELHAELINGLVEVTPQSSEPIPEPIDDFVRRIAGNEPFEMATVVNCDNENDRITFEINE